VSADAGYSGLNPKDVSAVNTDNDPGANPTSSNNEQGPAEDGGSGDG